jgi:hypothetical protein
MEFYIYNHSKNVINRSPIHIIAKVERLAGCCSGFLPSSLPQFMKYGPKSPDLGGKNTIIAI